MKYWENGFYLEQNENKTRYKILDEYWQELIIAQSKGKEITTDETGKPIAVEHIATKKELTQNKIFQLKQDLAKLSEDLIQSSAGEIIDDIEIRKTEFIKKHNELRLLLGKEARKIKEK